MDFVDSIKPRNLRIQRRIVPRYMCMDCRRGYMNLHIHEKHNFFPQTMKIGIHELK